jgi:predicted aldo/keto reductase-like oxidoreductase
VEHGINYFDTAWGYHDGRSEVVIGKILRGGHLGRK